MAVILGRAAADGECGSTHHPPPPPPQSERHLERHSALDFTPLLAQVEANHELSGNLLGAARMVLCLGSRAQICFLVGHRSNQGHIVGAATTEAEGLELVERLRPELLFASDALEEGCGLALVQAVKRRHRGIRTLLLVSRQLPRPRLRAAIEAGCDGLLLESAMGLAAGLEAIRTVCGGGIHLDQELAVADDDARASPHLSQRELEVLARLVRGESNGEIASHLYVSVDTIKTHLRNLLLKLQARDRTHAAVLGLQLGLVDWPEPWPDR
jgi:DNA-binding NarL/FixJ family response regulator